MGDIVTPRADAMKDKLPVLVTDDEDKGLVRRLLRESIDASGVKHESVAAALRVDGPYLSKMLTGEKPIGAKHLRALPDDVEVIFARLYAESFGLIVVQPSHGDAAVRNLVSGLFGVLGAAALPQRASRMAKGTELSTAADRKRA